MRATRLLYQHAPRKASVPGRHATSPTSSLGRPAQPTVPPVAASHLFKRIGKCLAFGCNPEQTSKAVALVRTVVNDWPRIQMAAVGCRTPPKVAHEQTLLAHQKPGRNESFHLFPQLSQAAAQAVSRFLGHLELTVPPENHWLWKALPTNKVGHSPGRLVVTHFDLKFQPSHEVDPGRINAYAQLQSYHFMTGASRVNLELVVFIWSIRHMAWIAKATIDASTSVTNQSPSNMEVIEEELKRAMALSYWPPGERAQAREEQMALLSAIDSLEAETWNRDGAVEDFGPASPL
ncbi:hypothetical protein LX36DRAFT_712039 [Colletotrichum falcatum]|nr:hypothetical protein LX36DRAFT_712039 [Colletotrichum falcatum]